METTNLVLLAACLAMSAFFSGSETALISMTKLRVMRAIGEHGPKAEGLRTWLNRSDHLLTTILIGNNLTNIAATSVTAVLVSSLIPSQTLAVVVNSVVMTSLILVLSEILPKMIAKRRPAPVAMHVLPPLVAVGTFLTPVVWLFGGIARAIARLMGSVDEGTHAIGRDDVEAVVDAAGREGSLGSDERLLLEEALGLRTTVVREIMTPRIKMTTVRQDTRINSVKALVAETGYSRLPVEGAAEGEFVGVLFAKDLLLAYEVESAPAPLIVADVMRSARLVPEVVTIDRLLALFRSEHMHMAIVIGEYGDVVGLVTMEDVLEQLVGHIEDEFDRDRFEIRKLSARRSVVDGDARLDDLRRYLAIEFPEGDYETIGGFMIHELGRIPSTGAVVRLEGWIIQVLSSDERRVLEVALQYIDTRADSGQQGGRTT